MVDRGDVWFIVSIMTILLIVLVVVFALGADVVALVWGGGA